MQVTNGSVTLELQQATKNTKIRNRNAPAGQRLIRVKRGHFYVIHADGNGEYIGDVFPANGWAEVGTDAPSVEPVVEEATEEVANEEAVPEYAAEEEPVVEEEPAPAPKKQRRRIGRRR